MADSHPNPLPDSDSDRYHGFSLKSVCWGYRDIFRETIDGLFQKGYIGPERHVVTEKFFSMLKSADQSCFDYLLKEFLGALNPTTRWILDLPGIFSDVTDMGRQFAEKRLYYGIRYFKILGDGGFGDTPAQIRALIDWLKMLHEIRDDLAIAFLKGYRTLIDRLTQDEINRFIRMGIAVYSRNAQAGLDFMKVETRGAENAVRTLSHECGLEDVRPALEKLIRALTGISVEIADLGSLDSDELIERGSNFVCMFKWAYMPLRIRRFDTPEQNRNWYMLMGVVAAGMLSEQGFPTVHGYPEFASCEDLVGTDTRSVNLFQIIEYVRILNAIRRKWPGINRLLDFALDTEKRFGPPPAPADILFFDAIDPTVDSPAVRRIRAAAEKSVNAFDTAEMIRSGDLDADQWDDYPDSTIRGNSYARQKLSLRFYHGLLHSMPLRAFGFLPDMRYHGTVSDPPADNRIAEMNDVSRQRRKQQKQDDAGDPEIAVNNADPDPSPETEDTRVDDAQSVIRAAYIYDEWSHDENDYRRDWCTLSEMPVYPTQYDNRLLEEIGRDARRVRSMFERIRPEISAREKYLESGDAINTERLVEFLVDRRNAPAPDIRFYERILPQRRDLAVLILLDVSGSTVESVSDVAHSRNTEKKVIDIVKQAALIFGQGLAVLGDRFSICGFSGNGRDDCRYFVFKDFSETWDQTAIGRVLSARPLSSTRIGPALRHSGKRLQMLESRQRLIILITDGKPMDAGYSPSTRYAQYDVRMACEENQKKSIHTFGISTEENTVADMEIMFPGKRFAILPDIRKLPDILPKLYLKLTF